MSKIIAVKKDSKGVIEQYKLDNGNIIGVAQAVQMTKNEEIENCSIGRTKDGKETIRSKKDNDLSNNLDNLPTF